jgi:hypothetical protein
MINQQSISNQVLFVATIVLANFRTSKTVLLTVPRQLRMPNFVAINLRTLTWSSTPCIPFRTVAA